jgi:hypothetical protein
VKKNGRLHPVAAVMLLPLFLLGFNASASEIPPELAKFRAERAQMAANLAVPIAVCEQHEDTSNPAFHGCMDWHSSVHGIWALTAYSWATHDTHYNSLVESALRPELLAEERKHLDEDPDFEMPYGRAWFLRLAIDHRKIARNDALDNMADDVAASLVAYFMRVKPNPGSIAYKSSTWALINLFEYGKSRDNAKLMNFVSDVVSRDYLQSGACPVQGREIDTREFMALCTNWAWLVSDVLPRDEFTKWLNQFMPADRLVEPIETPSSVHQNGLNFSRSWGLWNLYWKTDDTRYLDSYLKHMRQGYSHPETWNGGYETVAHWVPQFGMLGLMVSYYDWP